MGYNVCLLFIFRFELKLIYALKKSNRRRNEGIKKRGNSIIFLGTERGTFSHLYKCFPSTDSTLTHSVRYTIASALHQYNSILSTLYFLQTNMLTLRNHHNIEESEANVKKREKRKQFRATENFYVKVCLLYMYM